ncbi:uncharacterized protein LOC131237872 isoform X1 [Magnolia sinica]|uniref:uncharacterized protein LOC131237872 isoform X1 n=1 Tax=Magnolia sinica TaxID=86752 RepID=UPI00265A9EA7|nr:uncharacterized protein LOC131237872 isoform X1 [Magnolia sinica]
MAYLGRFLLPIRVSFSSLSPRNSTLSPCRNPLTGKYAQLKTWMRALEPAVQTHVSKCQLNLNMQRKWINNLSSSGKKMGAGSIVGLSVLIGSTELYPTIAYAMDENEILAEEHRADFWDASGCLEDEDPHTFWPWARKCWLPALLVLTVVMGWEHPLTLAIKVALFLFSTKPSPLSVYLFIEQVLVADDTSNHGSLDQGSDEEIAIYLLNFLSLPMSIRVCSILRHRSMRQDPGLYKLKAFYAKKVEVEDYKLLCLARVELRDKKITLMGILGSWWVLQSSPSPSPGVISFFGQ